MGVVFWIFGYISGYVAVMAMVLCIASALYILSELAEEFSTTTIKVLRWLFIVVTGLQIVLLIDGLPLLESAVQLIAIGSYALTYQKFPFIDLFSPTTLTTTVLFLITNILWLRYFLKNIPTALPIIGFFLVVVWAVPIGLFVSMSTGDTMLPGAIVPGALLSDHSASSSYSTTTEGRNRSVFRMLYDHVSTLLNNLATKLGVLNPMRLLQEKKR
jgi:hypothetical protein